MTRYDELQQAIKTGKTIEIWVNSKLNDVFMCFGYGKWKDSEDKEYDIIEFSMLMGYYNSKEVVFKYR